LLWGVLGQKGVGQYFRKCRPVKRSFGEEFRYQSLGCVREGIRVDRIILQDPGLGCSIVILIKRQFALQKGIEDNPKTPDIDLFTSVLFTSEHFRGTVAYCSAKCLEIVCLSFILSGEAKIA